VDGAVGGYELGGGVGGAEGEGDQNCEGGGEEAVGVETG